MLLLLLSVIAVFAQDTSGPEWKGNCLSMRIDFKDQERIFHLNGIPSSSDIPDLDTARYDLTVDYASTQVEFPASGGAELFLVKDQGVRMSTTRFMRYGKVTGKLKVSDVHGVVTTFITMGPHLPEANLPANVDKRSGDEIDWEILGKDPMQAQSNIFFRGIREMGVRNGVHKLSSSIKDSHIYEIDWKHDKIEFNVDGVKVRDYTKNGPSANRNNSGLKIPFFPDRPGKVSFAIWSEPGNSWAGGPVRWPDPKKQRTSSIYEWIDIQCYDDNDQPVPKWPLTDNPDFVETINGQPTKSNNGIIPIAARPNGRSAVGQQEGPNQDFAAETLAPLPKGSDPKISLSKGLIGLVLLLFL